MFNGKVQSEEEGGGGGVLQTGAEVVESAVLQLKEVEWVSIEDPLHVRDMDSLRQLKDVSAATALALSGTAPVTATASSACLVYAIAAGLYMR